MSFSFQKNLSVHMLSASAPSSCHWQAKIEVCCGEYEVLVKKIIDGARVQGEPLWSRWERIPAALNSL